jgi:hypothetical protein
MNDCHRIVAPHRERGSWRCGGVGKLSHPAGIVARKVKILLCQGFMLSLSLATLPHRQISLPGGLATVGGVLAYFKST